MPEVKTLYTLRTQSGLSCREIVERMGKIMPKAPQEPTTIIQWEYRGCDRISSLAAYAAALGVELADVMRANENSRKIGRPRPGKGKGQNNFRRSMIKSS